MISIAPLIEDGPVVVLHTIAAIVALLFGLSQLLLRQGIRRHHLIGYTWVTLMMAAALSGFWVHELRLLGPFRPIHA